MRFTVVWEAGAMQKLAALWATADNRDAITQAGDWIDATLRRSGDTSGVLFLDELQILAAPPIAVLFTRSLDDRMIRVVDVLIKEQDTP